ncbi:MAG: tetratricopeptide repeat protein [Phycisphaeraceae bacterium]
MRTPPVGILMFFLRLRWFGPMAVLMCCCPAVLAQTSIPLPPGLRLDSVQPLQGEDRQKALMTLEEVLASVPEPSYLRMEVVPSPGLEPPRAAQHAYVAAREAWLDGRPFDAIPRLLTATRMAPNEPAFHELLARIYAGSGSSAAAQRYAREAIAADPDRLSSLLLLLRLSADENDHAQTLAIAGHLKALLKEDPAPDPAIRIIVSRLLGQTLLRDQHLVAAREALADDLYPPNLPPRSNPLDNLARTMALTRPLVWRELGDAAHRLGLVDNAMKDYARSAETALAGSAPLGRRDQDDLLVRLLWTELLMDDPQQARNRLAAAFDDRPDDDRLLELAGYLFRVGAGDDDLLARLKQAYERSGQSDAMVIALARALPSAEAKQLLTEHLRSYPQATQVFEYLIREVLVPDGADNAVDVDLEEALRLTVRMAISGYAKPAAALDWVSESIGDRSRVTEQLGVIEWSDEREHAVARMLRGFLMLELPGRNAQAMQELSEGLELDPDLDPARVALVQLNIVRQQLDQAETLLKDVDANESTELMAVTSALRLAQGRPQDAIAVLDRARVSGLAGVELDLQRGKVLLGLGDSQGAEEVLLDSLTRHDTDEQLYRALFVIYEQRQGDSEAGVRWVNLMRRILTALPESPTARIKLAQWHATRKQFERAEVILTELLRQQPDEPSALRAMLDLYAQQQRITEGNTLLDKRLNQTPDDLNLLRGAFAYYRKTGQVERLRSTLERLLLLSPPGMSRTLGLARHYGQVNQPALLLEVMQQDNLNGEQVILPWRVFIETQIEQGALDEAMKTATLATDAFPNQAAALYYQYAVILSQAGHDEPSINALERSLRADPDFGPSANLLGYTLVLQKRDLERAIRLIERAIQSEPNNGAYLDSLGWAYYKLGRMNLAVAWLERALEQEDAQHPVIIDHLGDAYFRSGRIDEAQARWREARDMLREQDWPIDREMEGLETRLVEKLNAVSSGAQPAVAPLSKGAEDTNEQH